MGAYLPKIPATYRLIRPILDIHCYEDIEDVFINNDCAVFNEIMEATADNRKGVMSVPYLMMNLIVENSSLDLCVMCCKYIVDVDTAISVLRVLLCSIGDVDTESVIVMFNIVYSSTKHLLRWEDRKILAEYIFTREEPGLCQPRQMIILDGDFMKEIALYHPFVLLHANYIEADLLLLVDTPLKFEQKHTIIRDYRELCSPGTLDIVLRKLGLLYIKMNIQKFVYLDLCILATLNSDIRRLIYMLFIELEVTRPLFYPEDDSY